MLNKKTYQENIVVEKSEEKGSKENWYPMAYPQKKEEKIGVLYFYMLFWFPKEMANWTEGSLVLVLGFDWGQKGMLN